MASTTVVPFQRDRLIELCGSPVQDAEFDELIKYIRSQPKGDQFLEGLSAVPRLPSPVPMPSAQGFTEVAAANMSIVNVVLYQKIQIKVPGKGKTFDGKSGGVMPGLPGGVFWGSISFNSVSDLSGDWKYFMFMLSPGIQVDFYHDKDVIMTFKAFGVGSGAGTAWGNGTWS